MKLLIYHFLVLDPQQIEEENKLSQRKKHIAVCAAFKEFFYLPSKEPEIEESDFFKIFRHQLQLETKLNGKKLDELIKKLIENKPIEFIHRLDTDGYKTRIAAYSCLNCSTQSKCSHYLIPRKVYEANVISCLTDKGKKETFYLYKELNLKIPFP